MFYKNNHFMWEGYRVGKGKATIMNRMCCVLLAGKVNELCGVKKMSQALHCGSTAKPIGIKACLQ